MKLSEAIRLGSLMIEKPKAGNFSACAITMANSSVGGCTKGSHTNVLNSFYRNFPWIRDCQLTCPKCYTEIYEGQIIWHMFDSHVMGRSKNMTIEQLADWVASIEPATPESIEGRAPIQSDQKQQIVDKQVLAD